MAYSFHPFPIISMAKAALLAVILSAALFLVRSFFQQYIYAIALVWALAILYSAAISVLCGFKTITLDDNSITYKSGMLSTKQFILPYSKITEANYSQGLLERILGIGTLSVDTPGGTDTPIRLGGVRYSDIKRTLDRISSKNK
jgi:uncharacterized membrane protein YdbT with pleckstrin-like domain